MDCASPHVVRLIVSRLESCCKAFPDECKECPEYAEIYPTPDFGLTGCFGLYFGPSYILKRCKRFNWKSTKN